MNLFRSFTRALGRPPAVGPRPPRRARLALEPLEDRAVPATVGALGFLEGDVLTVFGDDTDNTLIFRQRSGQITLDGGRFLVDGALADSVAANRVFAIAVIAGGGDDTILLDNNITALTLISGGDGDDVIVGGGGPNNLSGNAGNDRLYGRGGDDRLTGGDGNDLLVGGGGQDIAFGGRGSDLFTRSIERRPDRGPDEIVLPANPPTPQLPAEVVPPATPVLGTFPQPTEVSAVLDGDVLEIFGSSGDDNITLVLQDGQYSLSDGTPILTDDGPVDRLSASRVFRIQVVAFDGDDVINLSAARDAAFIIGFNGNDILIGGRGDDIIFGGFGDDLIVSGRGNDRVYGGFGNDSLFLGGGDDIVFTGPGADTVDGGNGVDRVADAGPGDQFEDIEIFAAPEY